MSMTSHAMSIHTASKYTCMYAYRHASVVAYLIVRSYGLYELSAADRNRQHC